MSQKMIMLVLFVGLAGCQATFEERINEPFELNTASLSSDVYVGDVADYLAYVSGAKIYFENDIQGAKQKKVGKPIAKMNVRGLAELVSPECECFADSANELFVIRKASKPAATPETAKSEEKAACVAEVSASLAKPAPGTPSKELTTEERVSRLEEKAGQIKQLLEELVKKKK